MYTNKLYTDVVALLNSTPSTLTNKTKEAIAELSGTAYTEVLGNVLTAIRKYECDRTDKVFLETLQLTRSRWINLEQGVGTVDDFFKFCHFFKLTPSDIFKTVELIIFNTNFKNMKEPK